MYEVLARKYRPTKLSEVVGQPVAVTILENAIKTGKLHHALLLYGPMGVGKTSLARIIAKSLNCENGPTVDPCGKCEACYTIAKGRDIDVIEIDGASNRKIENARNIIESVKYPPLKRKFKIYIIDEIHMFTIEAFNAMLKTIEEPPHYVKFIFATTAIEKVPETILSRCQILYLKKIPESEIAKKLNFIAKEEKISIEKGAVDLIAFASSGSLRIAEGFLDRCASYKLKGTITKDDVSKVVGIPTKEISKEFLKNILNDDTEKALNTIYKLSQNSINLEIFNRMVLDELLNINMPLESKTALVNIFYQSLADIKQKVDAEDALIVATYKAKAATNLESLENLIEKIGELTISDVETKPAPANRVNKVFSSPQKNQEQNTSDSTPEEHDPESSKVDIILKTLGGKIINIEKLNE